MPVDKDKLIAALGKLDVTKNEHWTAEGLPLINIVRVLAGDSSLTREQITAAAPHFTRTSAASEPATVPAGAAPTPAPVVDTPPASEPVLTPAPTPVPTPEVVDPVTPAVTPATVAEATVATATITDGDKLVSTGAGLGVQDSTKKDSEEFAELVDAPLSEDVKQIDVLRADLDDLLLELSQATDDQSAATAYVAKLQNEVGLLEGEISKLQPKQEDAIRGYLNAQKRLLQERGEAQRMVRESGINLKELNRAISPAPIDAERLAKRRGPRP